MPRLITLSRAARLVGVKRGALQQKIRNGELRTFEGEILLTDLLHCYPQAEVEDNSMLERVGQIMEQAVGKIVRPAEDLPDTGALATRVMALSRDLATARHEARRLAGVINRLQEGLDELERGDSTSGDTVGVLRGWLERALATEAADELDTDEILARETFLRVMAAQVRILPSGHEFFIEGPETILDAGLRSGLALPYGCSNGNCGLCKARLVSGETRKIRPHDYQLGEAEKELGYFLACSSTAVTDVVLEIDEAAGTQDIAPQDIDIRIRRIEKPDEHVVVLGARTPRTNRLRFLAGQYLSLSFDDLPPRDCAISSCPCDDMNLQFQVPLVPGEPFSEHLAAAAAVNDVIHARGPRGEFTLGEESSRSLLFIAGDAGFGPVKSLIQQALAQDFAESIHLNWITTGGNRHYMGNLCRSWVDALDNFHYRALEAADELGVAKLMPDIIAGLGRLDRFDCYVCMPGPLLDTVTGYLLDHGAPPGQLRAEPMR